MQVGRVAVHAGGRHSQKSVAKIFENQRIFRPYIRSNFIEKQ